LIIVAISSMLFLGAGALSVDIGLDTVVNRSLQSVADAGALDAARYINVEASVTPALTSAQLTAALTTKALSAATDNGSTAAMTLTEGLWYNNVWSLPANPIIGCEATVPPAVKPCNAVEVTAGQTLPHFFQPGSSALSRSAIAAVIPEAGFSIGSYLASFNSQQSGVLNVLLGKLGTSVSLTAVGYAGLANSYVTVQQLINASAGALTSTDVMTTSLTGAQWVSYLNTAMATQAAALGCQGSPTPDPCTANTTLTTLANSVNASTSATLCQMVSINGSSCAGGSLSQAALSTSINVLQTLTTEAELANGTNALDVTSALNIAGVTSAELVTTLVQIPQDAFGPVGTPATTSQVNADLQLTVLGIGLLDIPITAADGTATLQTITCSDNAMTSTKINASTTAATGSVTLLGLPIATLAVNAVSTTTLGYSATVVPPTATTVANDTNPVAIGSTSPTFSFGGLSVLSPVYALLNTTLQTVLGPVLQAVGVSVGGADVADLTTVCGSVSLTQ
jgi:uncharacterized membrane protein